MEASALSAPVALSRPARPAARLLRLRSDEQLVALFRAGSEEAFGVIHERYRQRLFAYTRQMLAGSRQDAEDALQDVFLRAYASLQASERPVSLRAWLYRVAHNRCIDQLRRPVPAHSDVFEMSRGPLHDPLVEAERRDDLRRLVGDVRRLPEAQRSALLMREMEGLSYEELAVALETTVPAIKSLLVRARMGLVEAREARDTACTDIRRQLVLAYDRGVRASGQARRHMRECSGCREYRSELRGMRRSFAALAPAGAGGLGLLAHFGIGGGGASAAAGGGAGAAAGTGGGAAALGGTAAVATAGKVVAVVASVAVMTAGAATEVQRQTSSPPAGRANAAHVAPPATAARSTHLSAGALAERHPSAATTGVRRAAKGRHRTPDATDTASVIPPVDQTLSATGTTFDPTTRPAEFSGGMAAPDEPADTSAGSDQSGSGSTNSTPQQTLSSVTSGQATGGGAGNGPAGSGASGSTSSSSSGTGTSGTPPSGSASSSSSSTGPSSSPRSGTEQNPPPGGG